MGALSGLERSAKVERPTDQDSCRRALPPREQTWPGHIQKSTSSIERSDTAHSRLHLGEGLVIAEVG
jgi:hypothetical protein